LTLVVGIGIHRTKSAVITLKGSVLTEKVQNGVTPEKETNSTKTESSRSSS